MTKRLLAGLFTITVVAAGLLNMTPAAAHDGEGVLVLEPPPPTEGLEVPYVVRLTWENDGHAAIDSTVTATILGADGTPGTPVPMEAIDQDGRYRATLTFPGAGTWTVRFTSVTPSATIEADAQVTAPTTTTLESTTTTDETTTTSTSAADTDDGGSSSDGGGLGIGAVIAVVLAAVLIGVVALRLTRSSRRLDGPDS